MDACILGTGAVNSSGYHGCYHEGVKTGAHRAAFVIANNLTLADIKGRVVKHSCDNRRCRNPAHLSLGTQKSNLQEMVQRGRHNLQVRSGELNGNCILTDAQVAVIRGRYVKGARYDHPNSAQALAHEFGVSRNLIAKITLGVARVKGSTSWIAGPI